VQYLLKLLERCKDMMSSDTEEGEEEESSECIKGSQCPTEKSVKMTFKDGEKSKSRLSSVHFCSEH
jgi:hypothetical protein